jgi:two-component system CheB/CheR fusion protein
MQSSFIAAVAGSAGSLASLKEFFDHTPSDGITYVIVQHLPKEYKSQLNLILKRHSALDVLDVFDGAEIEPDRIYVAPASKYMTIQRQRFVLQDRNEPINRSMDIFLTSVAANYGRHAVGVLLSGMDSDGLLGIKKIKEMGGLTIAQSPATCQYPELPAKAIRAGHIQYVLDSKDMAACILRYTARAGSGMKHQ